MSTSLNVQFSGSTQETIVAWFSDPQSAATFPNQGQVQTNDPRWSAFYGALNKDMQEYIPAPTST